MTTVQHPASEDPIRNERFRLGIEGSGIGVWDLDLATHRLLWSNTTRALFGVPDDLPLTYDLFLSLLGPGRTRAHPASRRAIRRDRLRFRRAVPGKRAIAVTATGFARAAASSRANSGGPGHLSGIIIEIDDQKQIEEALRTRESHLHSILETIPDAMIVIDGNGIMQFFSSAAERQFGYTEREAIGQNVSMLMPNPDRSRHDGYLARYRSTGERHIIGIGRIVTGQRKDGTTFPMHLIDRRNAVRRSALLHRLRPRSDRTAADPGAASGTAIRTRPRLAPERDGRDGLGACARAQSAARRDQQLYEGFAPSAERQRRPQHCKDRKRAGPRRRTGDPRRDRSSGGCAISWRGENPRSASKAFRS